MIKALLQAVSAGFSELTQIGLSESCTTWTGLTPIKASRWPFFLLSLWLHVFINIAVQTKPGTWQVSKGRHTLCHCPLPLWGRDWTWTWRSLQLGRLYPTVSQGTVMWWLPWPRITSFIGHLVGDIFVRMGVMESFYSCLIKVSSMPTLHEFESLRVPVHVAWVASMWKGDWQIGSVAQAESSVACLYSPTWAVQR